jgi:alkylation response protein AidB-like acyl-CoA dehydrogenase
MSSTSVEERQMLTESVRAAASASSPRALLSEDGVIGTDETLWKTLSRQIGLSGLLVPEELGGAGAGVAEVAAVLGELGSLLSPVPALSSLGMAGPLLVTAGDSPPVRTLLGRLGEGVPVSVAWPHPEGADLTPTLRLDDATLRGEARFVLDGMAAQVLLVPVAGPEGVVLVAVDAEAAGVRRTPMTALDLTRGLAAVSFDRVDAVVLTEPQPSADFLLPGLDIALTCIAAEQVGIAAHCLDEAVAWAKERVQFDRPIGSFQAIKHTLVDLLQDVELSRSALDIAVAAADAHLDGPTDETAKALRVAASAAKAMCGDTATRVSDESLHVFGGIGFTWEHDAHLYFRRARTLELLLGAPADHRARLAATLGVGR